MSFVPDETTIYYDDARTVSRSRENYIAPVSIKDKNGVVQSYMVFGYPSEQIDLDIDQSVHQIYESYGIDVSNLQTYTVLQNDVVIESLESIKAHMVEKIGSFIDQDPLEQFMASLYLNSRTDPIFNLYFSEAQDCFVSMRTGAMNSSLEDLVQSMEIIAITAKEKIKPIVYIEAGEVRKIEFDEEQQVYVSRSLNSEYSDVLELDYTSLVARNQVSFRIHAS